jgi:hypothetical protein
MELEVLKVVHNYDFVFWVPEYSIISKFGVERGRGIYCFR